MDFAIIRLGTSPIPIGRTPELLSIGIDRHAANAYKLSGWIDEVHRRRANVAMALHKFTEALLKDVMH